MKKYTIKEPVFNDEIMITETGDPGHADNINAAPKQIFENTLVNKKEIAEGDSKNRTVAFDSGDGDAATKWTDVPVMKSGETHKSLFEKISTMVKNVRFLYKVLGSTDLSAMGDGTVTGILSALKPYCFADPVANLLANIKGKPLDATQGAVVQGEIDDLQDAVSQINSDLSDSKIEIENITSYFNFAPWVPYNGYDPLQENCLLAVYSVNPSLTIAQGYPPGNFSGYGTIFVFCETTYKVMLYIDLFNNFAIYTPHTETWSSYSKNHVLTDSSNDIKMGFDAVNGLYVIIDNKKKIYLTEKTIV